MRPPVTIHSQVQALVRRGVVIPCPESVEVGDDVIPERIAPGVVVHTGCKLLGAETSIGPGCELGAEAPATVDDCQLGRDVALRGGYFAGAVFLDGASMGSAAHVRPGTLLEEGASCAHAVGLKQTVLLPFVTAGSLINFCDALMAGGTSRTDHSEIGSSYIHFNYTPHGDKATASLVGDVPRGVMLDRPPVFLGGQGGLVGPVRIAYGVVLAAGSVCRHDVLDEGTLYTPPPPAEVRRPFRQGAYRSIDRILTNNLAYIGNLRALERWYRLVRRPLMAGDPYAAACHAGALRQIEAVLEERIERVGDLAARMERSLALAAVDGEPALPAALADRQRALAERWPELEASLREGPPPDAGAPDREAFLAAWARIGPGEHYLDAVRSLSEETKAAGTAWLQSVVDAVTALRQSI